MIGQLLLGLVCPVYTMQHLFGQELATELGAFGNSIFIDPAAIRCLFGGHQGDVEGERSSYMNKLAVGLY